MSILEKGLFLVVIFTFFSCFNLSSAGIVNSQLANPSHNATTPSIIGSWNGVDNDGKTLTLDFSNDGRIRLQQDSIDFIGYYRVNGNFINLSVDENFDQMSDSWSFQLSDNKLVIKSSDGSAQLTRGSSLSPNIPSNDTFLPDGTYSCSCRAFQKFQSYGITIQNYYVFSGDNFQYITNYLAPSFNLKVQVIANGKYSISGNMLKQNILQINSNPHIDINSLKVGERPTLGEQPPVQIEYIQGGFSIPPKPDALTPEMQAQMQQYNMTISDFRFSCVKIK